MVKPVEVLLLHVLLVELLPQLDPGRLVPHLLRIVIADLGGVGALVCSLGFFS